MTEAFERSRYICGLVTKAGALISKWEIETDPGERQRLWKEHNDVRREIACAQHMSEHDFAQPSLFATLTFGPVVDKNI